MEEPKENEDTSNTKTDLQSKYDELKKQKEQIEHEFGLKRAKFKSMYLECEGLAEQEKEKRKDAENIIKKLNDEMENLKSNTEGIQTAAKVTEETRQEEIAALKVKHHEEMASMEHIWREAIREARATTAKQFEEEYKRLTAANQKLEQQMKELKSEEKSDGIMSIVSQAIRRGSMNPSTQPSNSSASAADGKKDLGDTMNLAQKNVEAWRSIVVPLEQEISALKMKLKEANARANQTEARAVKGNSETTGPMNISSEKLQEQVKELQGYLDAERSSRTDLEMFVAVLNTQKGVLQEDADKLRRELHNVCRLLEQEKSEHRDLKETWRKANEQFLDQQMMLSWEIDKMRNLLTPAQMEKLSKEFRQSQSLPAKKIKTVAEEPYILKKSNEDLMSFDDEKDSRIAESVPRPLTPSDVRIHDKIPSSKSSSVDSLDGSNDDVDSSSKEMLHPVGSLEMGEELNEDHDVVKSEFINQSKSNVSSLDLSRQLKQQAIQIPTSTEKSHGDVSSLISASGEDAWAVISSPTVAELERKLHLNETGWSTMKETSSVVQTCMMCQNYEKQLQRLQKECILLKDRKDSLMNFAKKEKLDLRAEREKVEKLEKSICVAAEDAQNQVTALTDTQINQEKHLEELQKEFITIQQDVALQLRHLSEDRDRIMAELETLREENASLRVIQETLREDQQQNMAHKDNQNVNVLHDKLEQLKLNASLTEEQLRSEIMFLKDRVMAEQFDKENTEKILQEDIDLSRQEIARLKEQISLSDTGKRKDDNDENKEQT